MNLYFLLWIQNKLLASSIHKLLGKVLAFFLEAVSISGSKRFSDEPFAIKLKVPHLTKADQRMLVCVFSISENESLYVEQIH